VVEWTTYDGGVTSLNRHQAAALSGARDSCMYEELVYNSLVGRTCSDEPEDAAAIEQNGYTKYWGVNSKTYKTIKKIIRTLHSISLAILFV